MSGFIEEADGQLLFISDLEGCVPNWTPNANNPTPPYIPQNVSLCAEETYADDGPLCKFLSNKKNKIAFLGDYFDKGPGAETSIIGIAKLKTDFSGQVHIILGNRDINKLRLFYELKDKNCFKDITNGWQTWSRFFTEAKHFTEAEKVEKEDETHNLVDIILRLSMGADGLNPYWCEDKRDCQTNQKNYISKLVSVFTDPNDLSDFAKAVKTIFNEGKIVIYDSDFNVLMSHAGGFDKIVFEGYAKRIKQIKTALENNKNSYYFDKMEIARKGLEGEISTLTSRLGLLEGDTSTEPTISQPNPQSNEDTGTLVNDYDINNENGSFKLSNQILESVVKSIFGDKVTPPSDDKVTPPSDDFFILQASGLKPTADGGDNSQIFASFIQSCGSGCGQPPASKYLTELFKPKITYNNKKINFIAHGHVPHCLPFPLIVENNDTIFIHNDTSNGQKQTKNVGEAITTLPLAYLEKSGPKIGVIENGKMTPYSRGESFPSALNDYKTLIIDMNEKGPIKANTIETRIKWDGYKTAVSATTEASAEVPAEAPATEPEAAAVAAATEAAPAPAPTATGGKTRRRRKNRSRNSKKASSKRRPRRNRSRKRK
jgi:hypothetical protein